MDSAIQNIIESSQFIGGQPLKDFEKSFAKAHESQFCVGVGNGTDALEIAIEALDLPESSEIIVPANSFIATSETVSRMGHEVVFCDASMDDYTLDVSSAEKLITKKTKAIIPVHLYGHPCDMDPIVELAKKHDLKIIEDCAQAHLAKYKDQSVGTFGDFATFSFYPGKNLGAYGDGGAILTQDAVLEEQARMIANHGRKEKYDHLFEARNSRLDSLQAAVLSVKLKHLPRWTQRRIEIADIYLNGLSDIKDIKLPRRQEWANQVYHLFVIRTDRRDELKAYLNRHDIQSGIHYPKSLPKLQAYSEHKQETKHFKCLEAGEELLSLPIGEHLTDQEVNHVMSKVHDFFKES
jgi:dTDP-4-amino-4,6-dideoxygalactose transaminase